MRYEPDYKAKTRAKVLAEASKTMRAEGIPGMGVANVMAKAGLTHGAFYAHFDSKDALIDETIKEMILQARGRFEAVTGDLGPDEALRAYIDFYLSPKHRDNDQTSCPLPWVAGDVARLGASPRKHYGAIVAGLTELVAKRLRALQHADADAAAGSVVAELIGALALSRAVGDKAQSDSILQRSRDSVLARLGLSRP
ncbi:TetR/AcrR family transcriptional regulator [Scleromatobacter humisilvae]|uniref:TetR/AcrR family transcriptional regulator n=1 Tax=Scleromatobacter humisilvae TaxID=2897159 RepID=A0A9X1YMF8_9BURK|nr:TetR/AcrR family transcriptional regulator [Scleromatobacter humisilvae]MCK9687478.1 TetR/AcrR family transcriptional regulator [Scleromatobacter humisilvae]